MREVQDTMDFARMMAERLQERLPECRVEVLEVAKNNGLKLTGITISRPGSSTAPTIYVDADHKDYLEGKSFDEIEEKLFAVYQEHSGRDFDLEYFADFSQVSGHICYKLINAAKNEERLQTLPHRRFQDLAVIYYVPIEAGESESGSITVNNGMLHMWDTDEETLYRLACNNTPRLFPGEVTSMDVLVREMMGAEINSGETEISGGEYEEGTCRISADENGESLYVASNRKKCCGAAVILYDKVLGTFAEKIKQDFYILPSSVHETLFVPVKPGAPGAEELLQMVRDINATQVQPDEFLSDNIYCYHRKSGRLETICA